LRSQDTLRNIGRGLTEEDVRDAAEGLGISEEVIDAVMTTITQATSL